MPSTILAMFLEFSRPAVAMCSAGIALFLIGVFAAKSDIAKARGLDKIAALSHLCFAIPLAVFGAEHLSMPRSLMTLVPVYMPWRLFWAYFVGFALIAASLSIATKIAVRWSGLLFGLMMFLFVAMIHLPGALASHHDRIIWTVVFREMSFGGAGWRLAGSAINGWRGPVKTTLLTVGRILVAIAAILFGIEHFLHPLGLPGVPLLRQMPPWIPGRALIDYVTGAALLVAGVSFLLNRKTRTVATCVGGWILLLVLVIYGPVLILALSDPATPVQVEGINYFADTLLFAAAILTLATATPRSDSGSQMKTGFLNIGCIYLLAAAASGTQGHRELPKFDDFLVTEQWTGPSAAVKLISPEERLFRTSLREAAKQPPNFAGHFRFVSWGCGTNCLGGAVIDLKTGEVVQVPLAKNVGGEEHWIFCTSVFEKGGTEYRRESSLFILRCGWKQDRNGNNAPDTYFFNFVGTRFEELVHISEIEKRKSR